MVNVFTLISRIRQRCVFSPYPLNIVPEVRTKIKEIPTREEEVKLSLFTNNYNVCVKKSNEVRKWGREGERKMKYWRQRREVKSRGIRGGKKGRVEEEGSK